MPRSQEIRARGRLPLPQRFKEAVVVHPTLTVLVAQHGNPARGHKSQSENFPVFIGKIPLLGGHASAFPCNGHTPPSSEFVYPYTDQPTVMPLKLDTCPLGLGDAEGFLVRLLHSLSFFDCCFPICHTVLPHLFLFLVICPAVSLSDIGGENNRRAPRSLLMQGRSWWGSSRRLRFISLIVIKRK